MARRGRSRRPRLASADTEPVSIFSAPVYHRALPIQLAGVWMERDFFGYGASLPDPGWPNGARIAVSFVVKSKRARSFRSPTATSERAGVRDHRRSARRARSVPRQPLRVRHARGLLAHHACAGRAMVCRVTLNACGRAIARSPWVARDAVARGHEVACHGWRWETPCRYGRGAERETIARAVAAIADAVGAARGVAHEVGDRRSTRAGCWWSMAASSTTATPTTTICRTSCRWRDGGT